jgi:hypothetical protein
MVLYDNEREFHDIVLEFVRATLAAGDSVVVIATAAHRGTLAEHYARHLPGLESARVSGRYIEVDTSEAYDSLIADGWPDRERIDAMMAELVERARRRGGNVRCIGEIVAVIWNRGEHAATIRLEHIWRELAQKQNVDILCLYPRAAFDEHTAFGLSEVDRAHGSAGD